jgi:hypothetical protein
MPPGNMSWVIRDRLGSASRLGHIRSVPKRFESRAHRDDGIDQLNYLEESLVCLAQVNGPTIARSTSARPQAVLSVRIISNGANRTRAA